MGTIIIIASVVVVVSIILDLLSNEHYAKERLDYNTTTVIKGIAIFVILLSHISGNLGVRFLTPLGGIGVALFLFISGYGLNESYQKNGLNYFWRKRLIAVYPAYLTANIIAWILYGIIDVKSIFLGLIFVKPAIPYGWYFHCLILWYVLFWISKNLFKAKYSLIILFIALLASVVCLPEIMAEQSASFFMGVVLSEKEEFLLEHSEKKKTTLGISLIVFGVLFLGIKQISAVRMAPQIIFNIVQMFIKLPIAMGLVYLVLSKCLNKRIKLKLFYLFGLISYEFYLLHGMCINYLTQNGLLFIASEVSVSILLAILFHKFNGYIVKQLKQVVIERYRQ